MRTTAPHTTDMAMLTSIIANRMRSLNRSLNKPLKLRELNAEDDVFLQGDRPVVLGSCRFGKDILGIVRKDLKGIICRSVNCCGWSDSARSLSSSLTRETRLCLRPALGCGLKGQGMTG